MLLAEITFGEVSTLLTMIFTFISTIFAMWIKYKQGLMEHKQDTQSSDVKNMVMSTTNYQNKKLDNIYTVVNGNLTTKLKLLAEALQKIAIITNHKDDIDAADKAKLDYENNLAQHASIHRETNTVSSNNTVINN